MCVRTRAQRVPFKALARRHVICTAGREGIQSNACSNLMWQSERIKEGRDSAMRGRRWPLATTHELLKAIKSHAPRHLARRRGVENRRDRPHEILPLHEANCHEERPLLR